MKVGEVWQHNEMWLIPGKGEQSFGMLVKLLRYIQEKDGYLCAIKPAVRDENTAWDKPGGIGVFMQKSVILEYYHLVGGVDE